MTRSMCRTIDANGVSIDVRDREEFRILDRLLRRVHAQPDYGWPGPPMPVHEKCELYRGARTDEWRRWWARAAWEQSGSWQGPRLPRDLEIFHAANRAFARVLEEAERPNPIFTIIDVEKWRGKVR